MKINEQDKDDLALDNFVRDNLKTGGLKKELADKAEKLYHKYKQPRVTDGCAVITAEFGTYGKIEVKFVYQTKIEYYDLKYKAGFYDLVCIRQERSNVWLVTDYSPIEPYDRQDDAQLPYSFEQLGDPDIECNNYRAYVYRDNQPYNICFPVWGFQYNTFYRSVKFGMAINRSEVSEFMESIKELITK